MSTVCKIQVAGFFLLKCFLCHGNKHGSRPVSQAGLFTRGSERSDLCASPQFLCLFDARTSDKKKTARHGGSCHAFLSGEDIKEVISHQAVLFQDGQCDQQQQHLIDGAPFPRALDRNANSLLLSSYISLSFHPSLCFREALWW